MIRHILFLILSIGSINCVQYGSLSFVIDDTKSMEEDISKVRNAVDGIMDIILNKPTSQIKDVVLVTFNDPAWLTKLYQTKTREELKNALKRIKVHGGGDCPEYSMTGILLALENSLPNSYLFVFTDAPPKDIKLIPKVKRIAQTKESQIIFVRTPGNDHCRTTVPESEFKPYYDIAASTYGQVFTCDSKKEVEDILHYVNVVISGSAHVTKRLEIPPNKAEIIPFNVDDQTEYVVVSASGMDVHLDVIDGPTKSFEKVTWINNAKVLKINNPDPGDYKVTVKGSSTTSILIFGRTDFTFQHGFSEVEPASFNNDKKQPTDGTRYHLLVNVTDPNESVEIKSAEILTKDGVVIIPNLLLKKKSKSYYTTDLFLPPNTTFLIAIKGIGKSTRKEIRRIAKTPIDSRPKNSDPVLDIPLPSVLAYNDALKLSCNVNAYPKPKIVWKDSNGKIIPSLFQRTYEVSRYHYVSELKLDHVRKSETFYCYAENEQGDGTKHVDVIVKSPFIVNVQNPYTSVTVEYGRPSVVHCNIKSSWPIQINWYYKDKEIINSNEYTITKDGTILIVQKVTENDQGNYKCRATIRDDRDTAKELITNVKTNGMAPSMGPAESITVKENSSLLLNCHVTHAYPTPTIKWLFKKAGETESRLVAQSAGEQLKINKVLLDNAGVYTCVAKNIVGESRKDINLNVQVLPKMKLLLNQKETSRSTIAYGSDNILTCHVISHVQPSISWKDSKGNNIPTLSKIEKSGQFNYYSQIKIVKLIKEDTYTCEVNNEVGTAKQHVHLQPDNPFISKTNHDSAKFDYGKAATVYCPIKAHFETLITWYRVKDLKSSNREAITNSNTYVIANSGKELKIKKVVEGIEGKYICVASIKDDKDTTQEHATDVTIIPIAPIMGNNEVLSVNENNPVVLKCNIISAYPKAKVTWHFKRTGDTNLQTLAGDSVEYRIAKTELLNSGVYTCTAQNNIGKSVKTTTLVVKVLPKVNLKLQDKEVLEDTKMVDYNSNFELLCYVKSHVVPDIVWKNRKGDIIKVDKTDTLNAFEYISLLRINGIKRNEAYKCEVSNEVGTASSTASFVLINPLIIDSPEKTLNVKYRERATIKCEFKSKFPVNIKWNLIDNKHKIHEINNSDKYEISNDGSGLIIKQMDLNLDGKYKCTVSLRDDTFIQKTHTTLVRLSLENPEIDVGRGKVTVLLGRDAVLNCRITRGNPRPKLTWMVKEASGTFQPLLENFAENMALTVRNVTYEDAKLYKCLAVSVAGNAEKFIQLEVEGSPIITSDGDKVFYAVEGDYSLIIPCEVKGHPTPEVEWLKGTTRITSNEKYTIEKGALILKRPKEEDSLSYTCIAKNKFGKVAKTNDASVSKNIEDENFGNITYVYMLRGQSKELKCESKTSLGRWFQETWPTNITGTLKLKDVTTMNDGNFTCRTSDERESKSHTYIVDVGFPPKFIRDQDDDYVNWQGETKSLDCNVEMKPESRTVKVEWSVNGRKSNVEKYLHQVEEWGNYTCKISNYHGHVTKTFFITSDYCLIERNLLRSVNSPLLLDTLGQWPSLIAKTKYFTIKPKSKLQLSCHSKNENPNFIKFAPNKSEVLAVCEKEDTFIIDGVAHKVNDFECNKEVSSTIQETGQECGRPNTELINVGYNVHKFLEAYSVCFDKEKKMPWYSKITLRRPQNSETIKKPYWKSFKDFSRDIDSEKLCVGQCCVNEMQLVNDLDVREGPAQSATYIRGLNTIPYWNCSRIITWNKIEEEVRLILRRISKIDIWTGTQEYILNSDTNITYPKYLWKLVKISKRTMLAVVYVNDPNPIEANIRCKSLCKDYGLNLYDDRFTYCCSLKEFKENFSMPKLN